MSSDSRSDSDNNLLRVSDLVRNAAGVADRLRDRGVVPGRPVAAITASQELLCILAYALASIRCPFFPIDPALPMSLTEALLAQSGVDTVVGPRECPCRLSIPEGALRPFADAECPPAAYRADDIALLIATSGSSGVPKAVMLSAANLRASAEASHARTPLHRDDRWLACLPLFHIGGYSIVHRCSLAGAEAILLPRFDAAALWHALDCERVSHLSLVPTMLAQLLDLKTDRPPSTLRHVLVGGAALAPALAARAADAGWPIQPTYGLSEAASQAATLPALPQLWNRGYVGQPLPGVNIALADDGRLRIRGPMVMQGYSNPQLAPGDGLDDGWFTTSDLAEIGQHGDLTILGRADDVIVSGGKKILPQMVEAQLEACPGIAAAGVAGRADPHWGEVVTAIYVGSIEPQDVLAWCDEHLPGGWRPRRAIRLDALPVLANGKPDRVALRHLAEGRDPEAGG